MVDAVLIILAVGILAALAAMRFKPGSRRPAAVAGAPLPARPGGARTGALRTSSAQRPVAAPPVSPRPVATPPISPLAVAPPPGNPRPAAAPGPGAHHTAVLARPVLAVLEAVTGPQTGSRFALLPGDNRVGRAGGNQIRLTDVAVSSQHAIVRVAGGEVVIFDDASTNGTYVNGEQVLGPRRLQDGDQVTLGETTLAARLGPAPQWDRGPG